MNDSTEHPLQDALHAHVRDSGGDAAGPYLVGLADGALRVARRRQRLARAGVGAAIAAVVATAGVAVADGAMRHVNPAQPAAGLTGNTEKAARFSILPVTSITERACAPGSDGYAVRATATSPATCVQVDRTTGMTDVRAASAKALNYHGEWEVDLTLGPADRTRLADLTATLATAPAPRNEFAVVIDGKLQDVAYAAAPLTEGHITVTVAGSLTSATAHDLALRLGTQR